MNYPKMNEIPTTRDILDKFKGYNHNLRIAEGEFYNTHNLTSDHYPVLSPRKQRGIYHNTTNGNGLCSSTQLCYVDGRNFYVGDDYVDLQLTEGDKELIPFGSYVIVMPDQKYVNTVNFGDRGTLKTGTFDLPASVEGKTAKTIVNLVDRCGNTLLNGNNHIWVGSVPISDEEAYRNDGYWGQYDRTNNTYDYGGDYWFKPVTNYANTVVGYDLYQLYKAGGSIGFIWFKSNSYIGASTGYSPDPEQYGAWYTSTGGGKAPLVGIYFEDADNEYTKATTNAIEAAMTDSGAPYIKLNGIMGAWDNMSAIRVREIGEGVITDSRDGSKHNGLIISSPGESDDSSFANFKLRELNLVREGQVGGEWTPNILNSVIEITAPYNANVGKIPKMDFVIECQNRLWGCRYGEDNNGNFVNEIYASELGNFKSWTIPDVSISTSPFVASVATSGAFTGAVNYGGYPVFFKEDCIHRVFGNYTGQYQIQTTVGRGVQKDCHRSIALINEILYYKARSGVCAYDGSLPVEISQNLGDVAYGARLDGDKDEFVGAVGGGLGNKYYISMRRNDNKEWNLFTYDTAKNLWFREDDTQVAHFCNHQGELYYIDYADHYIHTINGTGLVLTAPIKWGAETGILGANTPDNKYVSRIDVRMSLVQGARVTFYIEYDSSGDWEHLFTMDGTTLKSFTIPVRPKRCDHFRLKIVGSGEAKIYSISKTIEEG